MMVNYLKTANPKGYEGVRDYLQGVLLRMCELYPKGYVETQLFLHDFYGYSFADIRRVVLMARMPVYFVVQWGTKDGKRMACDLLSRMFHALGSRGRAEPFDYTSFSLAWEAAMSAAMARRLI